MNTDIRIALSFSTHRKRKKLERLLGPRGTLCLIDLWSKVAEHRPKGVLTGMTEEDIAFDASWPKEPDRFCKVLCEIGFMDRSEDGTYSIHDWKEHQGYVFYGPERSEHARLMANRRWTKKSKNELKDEHTPEVLENKENENASGMPSVCGKHTNSNAPSPYPYPYPEPEPNPKNKRIPPVVPQGGDVPESPESRKDKPGSVPVEAIEWVVTKWTEICGRVLPEVSKITDRRRTAIRKRIEEYGTAKIEEVFRKVASNPFLTGENDRGWKADFDFVMSKSKFTKILEGSYQGSAKKKDTVTSSMEAIRRAAEEQLPHNQLIGEDQEIIDVTPGTGGVPALPDPTQPEGNGDPEDILPANGEEHGHSPAEEVLPEDARQEIYKKGVSQLLEVLNQKCPTGGDKPEGPEPTLPQEAQGPILGESLSRDISGDEELFPHNQLGEEGGNGDEKALPSDDDEEIMF